MVYNSIKILGTFASIFGTSLVEGCFLAEWQTSLEMSEKCLLCHLKMSVPQGKFAIQPFF